MQVATETELLNDYAPGLREPYKVFPNITARSRTYAFLAITALGLALRVYGLGLYSFAGDEYNSLIEARHVGLNWNSIIYSVLMHFSIGFGSSEAWMRLPAALFGVVTIPLMFQVGAKLGEWRTGAVAGLLAATSPFSIFHSQEVRFYSLFMFATTAFLLATLHYVDSSKALKLRAALIMSGALLLISHFLGVVVLAAQGTATFLAVKRRNWKTFGLLTLGVPLLFFGLPLLPSVRALVFALYRSFGNAEGASSAATPISLLSLAKMGFAAFAFLFGYHVYPLRLFLVVPGALLSGFLFVCGIVRLFQQRTWAALVLTYGAAFAGVYLVLDAIGGRVANGVSPRHVAFMWPLVILLVAMGLARFHRVTFALLLIGLLTVNALSLVYGWRKDWSYGPAVDYRAAAEYVVRQATSSSAIVFLGRAAGPADVYFPPNLSRVDPSPFFTSGDVSSLVSADGLILVSDEWRPERRRQADRLLRVLGENYAHTEGRVDYPLFEYAFSRESASVQLGNGVAWQLHQPLNIYGVEFQDLKLPATVTTDGITLQVNGAAEIPNADGENVVTISAAAVKTKRVVLLMNVTEAQTLKPGAAIAEVAVETSSQVVAKLPIRLGIETAAWDQTCAASANCNTVFQWHKRMSMTGQNSYPGAWRDFQAGIHATVLTVPQDTVVSRISIRYLAPQGKMYIWAVALDPGKL